MVGWNQVDDLLGLGCRDRRLETTMAHLEILVQDAEVAVQLQADARARLGRIHWPRKMLQCLEPESLATVL